MRPTSSTIKAVLLLCVLFGTVFAYRYVWYWGSPFLTNKTRQNHEYNYLTKNSGAHAVAMSEYMVGDDTNAWVSIIVQSLRPEATPATCSLQAYDYEDMHYDNWEVMAESFPCHVSQGNEASEGCVSANSHHKLWTFSWEDQSQVKTKTYAPTLTQHTPGVNHHQCETNAQSTPDMMHANAVFQGPDNARQCLAYTNSDPDLGYGLLSDQSTNNGVGWWSEFQRLPVTSRTAPTQEQSHPSLAVNDQDGGQFYVAYEDGSGISFKSTSEWAERPDPDTAWASGPTVLAVNGTEPCIAAIDDFVFVCWTSNDAGSRIKYRFSTNAGADWTSTWTAPLQVPSSWSCDRANVTAVMCGSNRPGVLIAARVRSSTDPKTWTVRGTFGRYDLGEGFYWSPQPPLCSNLSSNNADEPLNPSIAATPFTHGTNNPHACYVASWPWAAGNEHGRAILQRGAFWRWLPEPGPASGSNTARLLWGLSGTLTVRGLSGTLTVIVSYAVVLVCQVAWGAALYRS